MPASWKKHLACFFSLNKMPPVGGERRGRFMIRKIIQIDEEKCNGCGLSAAACHEGAIGMVEGKGRLVS